MNQVYFGTIASYDDLDLFLADVDIPSPEPQRMVVDVPGRDGELDLSYGLSPETHFHNRQITLKFAMKDFLFQWQTTFSTIRNLLHGQRFDVTIEPETDMYWKAFCTVDEAKADKNKGTVTIVLDAEPYMYKDYSMTQTATSGGVSVTIPITRKTDIPTVTSAANITITKDGEVYAFDAGTHRNPELRLTAGNNTLIIKGSGSVTIAYKDGSL